MLPSLPATFSTKRVAAPKLQECKLAHAKLSAAEAAKLQKPPGRDSRASSPAGGKGKGKAKAKAGAKKSGNPSYCFKLSSPAGCNDSSCPYMHLSEDMVEEFKGSQKALKSLEKEP